MCTKLFCIAIFSAVMLTSCSFSSSHANNNTSHNSLPAVTVEKEIHRGMSQPEVANRLGDPTVVSKDGSNKERWIYEELASKAWYSKIENGVTPISGTDSSNGPNLMLAINPDSKKEDRDLKTDTQKPISVVIKYNDEGLVDTATYHVTEF